MRKIISVSIDEADYDFCKVLGLSISALLRMKILEFKEIDKQRKLTPFQDDAKIKRLQEIIKQYVTFLEKKELVEEFLGMQENVQVS
jgi:hypothetical protein